ncbi:TNT domain-containing protein [Streptomyces sulphureus]|uniref:TNT domain-containing protein n=1 Tax=Streptomyces sulphureus TaxID=47758 RepID=UPI00037FA4CA|nr:TNT domain-containing protein [Streptomyces sulphureus]
MSRFHPVRSVLTALAALAAASTVLAAPAAHADDQLPLPPQRLTHAGQQLAPAGVPHGLCTGRFLGDARLGPERLPAAWQRPVGPLLDGYDRTGGLAPADFLRKYWEGPADGGGWKYPPNDGFAEVNGEVDRHRVALRPGALLDRFGSEFGGFLAPAGDPYAKRALPPQSLNTRDDNRPCDYRVYRVVRSFAVWQGGIAPWFEQPGGGQQIKLDAALLDPGEGERLNVKWLLEHGYLVEVNRSGGNP